MTIIRSYNACYNDSMHEIIMDIEERGKIYGLPNIGIFENHTNLRVRGEPITALSIVPEHLHCMAFMSEGFTDINVSFHQTEDVGTPKQDLRLDLRVRIKEQGTLSRASLIVAFVFFQQRGWFESTEEATDGERARVWAEQYWPGYEDDAELLLEGLKKVSEYGRWNDGSLVNKEGNTKIPPIDMGIFTFE